MQIQSCNNDVFSPSNGNTNFSHLNIYIFCSRSNCESEKIFSITSIVQLDIMESLGILVFRTEKSGRDQSQVKQGIKRDSL